MSGSSASVTVDGVRIEVRKGKVFVGGKEYGPLDGSAPVPNTEPAKPSVLKLEGAAKIDGDIHGDLTIQCQGNGPLQLTVAGSILGNVRMDGGDLKVEQITGDVDVKGDVNSSMITGDVDAGGNVTADMITGDVNS